MIEIIKQQQDDENTVLWHFKLGGADASGHYRFADLSREYKDPQTWIDENPVLAQSEIDNGQLLTDVFGGYARAREWLYDYKGATIEAITVASWERVVESKPTATDDLQAIRIQVKSWIPKP